MYHTIENEDIRVTVSDLGATLVQFIEKKSGQDIVLGFDQEEDYLAHKGPHLGAVKLFTVAVKLFTVAVKLLMLAVN